MSHSFSGSWNKNQWIHGIFSCFSVILFWVAFNSLLVMTHDVRCCCCIERKHFSYNCFLHYLPSCWWCFRILFSHPFITFLTWLWYIANVISWQSHFTRTCNLSCSICFCEGTYLLIIQMFYYVNIQVKWMKVFVIFIGQECLQKTTAHTLILTDGTTIFISTNRFQLKGTNTLVR